MRKTRLVLIPGVKSLDTIGCLLLFLACPTIAFKGQENREVETICKAQNLKEFWVDSPWPGDADNIGWVRGYGGGTWPGNSQKQNTCNGLSTRSVIRTSRSDDRRVQARREVSRDDGIETRKIRLENDMRRETRREIIIRRTDRVRNIRDSRRVADGIVSGEVSIADSRRASENRADSRASTRSLDREIRSEREVRELDSRRSSLARDRSDVRVRSTEQRTVTTRELIDGRQNSRASARNVGREIRSKREVREPENRRAVLNRERVDAMMSAERRTVSNRDVLDGRRDFRVSIRSQDNRSKRQIRNLESRRASLTLERADSRGSDEQVRSVERRNVHSRHVDERTNSRITSRSLEREILSERDKKEHFSRRDSRFLNGANNIMPEERMREADMRVMNTRDVADSRADSSFSMRSRDRAIRSERDIRALESSKRTVLARERTRSREVDERRSVERHSMDDSRTVIDRRDSSFQNQRRDIRSQRELRELESQVRDRMVFDERVRTAERRTISSREVIDGRTFSSRSLDREMRYKREVREPEGHRATRLQRRSTNTRLHENRIENRRVLENRYARRDARLSNRALERQTRSEREAPAVNHLRNTQERDSRITENFRSADEQKIDNRRERENIRESRQSVRSTERETRLLDPQRAERNVMNAMRNSKESSQTHRRRRTATDTRESTANIRSEEQRRADGQGERESRFSRSLENIRSAEERRVNNRRLSMERRDSRLTIRSLEREVRSERDISDRRAVRDMRESKIVDLDTTRSNNFHGADSRRYYRLSFGSHGSQQSLSDPDNSNRDIGVNRRRTEEREARKVDRANPQRVSPRVADVEHANVRLARDESRSSIRLQRSSQSLEDIRQYDSHVGRADTGRESKRYESRSEFEREISRGGRSLARFTRGADERRNELGQARDQYIRSQRLQGLSRSPEGIRQPDQQIRLAQRGTRHLDVRRTKGEREIRFIEIASSERNSHRVDGVERADISLVRDNTRVLTRRTQREVKSVSDIRRSDRRADIRRENRIADIRRNENDRKIKTRVTATPERLSRLAADAERDDTRRVRDVTRSQTRLLREARSMEDVRRFDRQMSFTQNRRETTRSDSRQREVEHLSRTRDRATDRLSRDNYRSQRLDHEREIRSAVDESRAVTQRAETRRLDRREADHENRQRRLISADVRQMNNRDSLEAEIRRISKDASLKFESTRTFPKEARRSDRQRRVADVERNIPRKRRDSLTTESTRRFAELTELTNKPRRMLDTQERYAGKTNAMEREIGQELSNEGKNNFFESSKNALASWLTTDISRTDLNGIAETLMYGGIAYFALFSSVNKKAIF